MALSNISWRDRILEILLKPTKVLDSYSCCALLQAGQPTLACAMTAVAMM